MEIVLSQLAKLRATGEISQRRFDHQIQRLSRGELLPRNLSLLVTGLPDGRIRYLITQADGHVCGTVDCDCANQPN